MAEKIVQTAGREHLGEFAPEFAHLNDDVLFGEVWNKKAIDVKTKCIITVVSLMASGITDSSLSYHLQNAKAHGVTKEEIAAIITHATMYVGWPKGWAVFPAWQKRFGMKQPAQSATKTGFKTSSSSPSASRIPTEITLSVKAISRRCQRSRCRYSTSPLNRAAATIGISTTRHRAAVKC